MASRSSFLNISEFSGFTRKLVLWNVVAYFALLIGGIASPGLANTAVSWFGLYPPIVLRHGAVWQLVTYSFVHVGLMAVFFEMLSLWFLGIFIEAEHGGRWLGELYFISVVGAGISYILLYLAAGSTGSLVLTRPLFGSYAGIFGLLVAIATLHGNMEFRLFLLPISIKAKYMAAIYILLAVATFFGADRISAVAQLGGALAAWLFVKLSPRRGVAVKVSERWYGLRNSYWRWKRRRAASKFQVYMSKQGRDVRFDRDGKYIDPDKDQDPNDRKWMN